MNVKNYTIYSDKFGLSVLNLNCIDLATQEDKTYQIDYWAELFKATTWEEIKMLATKNEYISEASETLYKLSAEEKIRLQCEAQEDYYRNQRDIECMQQRTMNELLLTKSELTASQKEIARLQEELAALKSQ